MIPIKYEVKAKDHLDDCDLVSVNRQVYVARSLVGFGEYSTISEIARVLSAVDFGRNFIIFIKSDLKSSTGWRIKTKEIRYDSSKSCLLLTVKEIEPEGEVGPTMRYRFEIILLPLKYYPKTVECITPEGKPWPAEVKIE